MTRSVAFIISFLCASVALAENIKTIRCSFQAEGFEGGKSNKVSCAMTPGDVFSTDSRAQSPSEMCNQESNAFQYNYLNYAVDLTARTVRYDETLVISDFAKPDYIKHIMSKGGKTREQAAAEVDAKIVTALDMKIDSVDLGAREIHYRIGGGRYTPPKQMPTYMVRYGKSVLHYTVGVPEATIVEVTGDERRTWVTMRFGLCDGE